MVDYDEILKYIQEEILDMYPPLLDCNVHILPESLEYNVEFIFKIREDLSENQISVYYDTVDYKLFRYYEVNEIKPDYIIILSKI